MRGAKGSNLCCRCPIPCLVILVWIGIMGNSCFSADSSIFPAPEGFVHPSVNLLFQGISEGISFSSRESRRSIAELIKIMDREHMKHLLATDLNMCAPDNFDSWVRKHSQGCHPLTPHPERILISALILQIEILDILLSHIDNHRLEKLQKKRTMISVKKKSDSFFGDGRDEYFCNVLRLSEQIQDLQGALGVAGATTWTFPKNAKSFSAVENYLLEKILFLKNRSYRIMGK